MRYDPNRLKAIFDRTDGHCHLCHQRVFFVNYGRIGERGAWEIEHSRARSSGGTNHGNNLRPACITCNRSKGTFTTRTARRWHGNSRSPLSKERKETIRRENGIAGAALGALLLAGGGIGGVVIGACAGGWIGRKWIEAPKA